LLRAGLIHRESSTLQLLPIENSDGPLNVLAVREFDKPESARITGHSVSNHDCAGD
jgi:hypothetical protein